MDQQRAFLLHTSHKPSSSYCKFLLFTIFLISSIVIAAVFLFTKTSTTDKFLSSYCHAAVNPESCRDYVSEVVSDAPAGGAELLQSVLLQKAARLEAAMAETRKLKNRINGRDELGPVDDCIELLDRSLDLVRDSAGAVSASSHDDARAWLSAVLTNHVTCRDGLASLNDNSFKLILQDLILRARASLAILSAVSPPSGEMIEISRGSYYKLPSWITAADRRLLQSSGSDINADLTVAKDGSGKYKTVAEAIAAAPDKSKKRYVIRVKKGTYKENVEVGKKKQNIMIVGDGMDSTIITGNLNVVDGSTTFKSATLAAVGQGFILQDICIQNTAGPEKHQAVALRVGADQSVINRCRIEAYQDTLYAHSLRQFYRDSVVSGTVDFIFGNAAVVLQKCKLEARKPMNGQKNMVTAQGRVDPNQNTGTSIQDCEIRASTDLEPVKASFPTYLGRPWKEYSRTVVMQSYIGDHIVPAGWSEWSGDFALKTLYYGEYMNRGPGAGTGKRVKWAGYHVITDAAEASKFTVKQLIQGGEWLASTGVAYTEGL